MKMKKLMMVFAILCLAVQAPCWANIRINMDPAGSFDLATGHYCPASAGRCPDYCFTVAYIPWLLPSLTRVDPPPVTNPPTPGSFDAIFNQKCGGEWTIGNRNVWNGTLTINRFEAFVCEDRWTAEALTAGFGIPTAPVQGVHCLHGVDLRMNYTPAAGDNVAAGDVRFVQRIQWWGNGCGVKDPHRDVIDSRDKQPFYPRLQRWQDIPGVRKYVDAPQSGCAIPPNPRIDPVTGRPIPYAPQNNCPNAQCSDRGCFFGFNMTTYLANDAGGNVANIHDGMYWGEVAGCLPGPNPRIAPPGERAPAGGVMDSPAVSYDPVTEVLSFEDDFLNVLNLDGGTAMDPIFANDPILGATISVPDFHLLMGEDGAYVFIGGKFSISKDDITFFEADIPTLLVDDDAMGAYTDSMYGVFENAIFDLTQGSAWLAAYASLFDSPYFVPELRASTVSPIEPSLAAGLAFNSEAYVWTAYCVPEPATVLLLGFGGLVLLRRRRGKTD